MPTKNERNGRKDWETVCVREFVRACVCVVWYVCVRECVRDVCGVLCVCAGRGGGYVCSVVW